MTKGVILQKKKYQSMMNKKEKQDGRKIVVRNTN